MTASSPEGLPTALQGEQQERLQNGLKKAVKSAGALALEFFGTDLKIDIKADGSKVSEADLAVDRALAKQLNSLEPSIAWLSEETPPSKDRLNARHLWVVDPIDGTSSFLDNRPDWSVAAALLQDGAPCLAAVFNPVRDEFFFAAKGQGASLNGKALKASDTSNLSEARVITSKGHFRRTFEHSRDKPDFFWRCSMAYRIALVAAGKADATVSLTPKSDWDIAASHLILEEAGGRISSPKGESLSYNQQQLTHKGVVATNENLYPTIINNTRAAMARLDQTTA